MLKISAPAKVNLVLEVLGRRPDGYHEIKTLMQTVGWNDWVAIEHNRGLVFKCNPQKLEGPHNLSWQAAQMLIHETAHTGGAAISLVKHIPEATGLGGGSSDAAATLLALSRLWQLEASAPLVYEMAKRLGSDVPFFLKGGMSIAEGRGERVRKLRSCTGGWVIIALPPVAVPASKTRQAYRALNGRHFTDGSKSAMAVSKIEAGGHIEESDIYNVFDLVADLLYPGIGRFKAELEAACGSRFHLSGAGPAIFALCSNRKEARSRVLSARRKGFQVKACAFSQGPKFKESLGQS